MPNVLTAFTYIVQNLTTFGNAPNRISSNRINAVTDDLESFTRNAFASIPLDASADLRKELFSIAFSYAGNQTNSPDLMLRGGDAIEVKKIETVNVDLALNSSYPKQKLHVTDPSLNTASRTCEPWIERDLIYVVGVAKVQTLQSI